MDLLGSSKYLWLVTIKTNPLTVSKSTNGSYGYIYHHCGNGGSCQFLPFIISHFHRDFIQDFFCKQYWLREPKALSRKSWPIWIFHGLCTPFSTWLYTHTIHVWYICPHLPQNQLNVHEYIIHGWYGIATLELLKPCHLLWCIVFVGIFSLRPNRYGDYHNTLWDSYIMCCHRGVDQVLLTPYFGCYAFDQFSGMCILHHSICEHTVVTALYSNGLSSMGYTAKVWQFAPLKWWLEDDPASFLGFGNFSGANSLLNIRGVSSGYHWKMNNKIVSMLHGHRVSPPFWPFAPHKTADFLSPIQTISRAPKLSHRIHIWYIYLDLP